MFLHSWRVQNEGLQVFLAFNGKIAQGSFLRFFWRQCSDSSFFWILSFMRACFIIVQSDYIGLKKGRDIQNEGLQVCCIA